MAAIDVTGLDVDLGRRRVLSDVNLSIDAGQLVSLVGPNGAGKTTLLRALLGLVPTRAGQIRVQGKGPRQASRYVGYVPQRHNFAWEFPISVEGVVMSGRVRQVGWLRQPRGVDYQAVRRALKRVEMSELAERTVGELSGGQRQRVLIARALATEPTALFLDEPFTGVDVPTQELLTVLARELSHEGTTVLMTTHDLPAAMATSDRVVLINKGIVAAGTPAEVSDPSLWMRAFGVSAGSPLLASIGSVLGDGHHDDEEAVAC